ncbi:S-acyl fatty acid synthase thioesterase, medium chain [Lates japonicus]|uniref:oleoyl-[acyl-carrier-protein] hydrolase n=1 Tax=Lates japonicus TaxID=270547 RepID=A0AAD3MS22_LATJO|nr:S-acyl fatty acid synthase thioesterase, medium chain [Lates japonicus]
MALCGFSIKQDGEGDQLFQEKTRCCGQADLLPLGRRRVHTPCTLGKRPQQLCGSVCSQTSRQRESSQRAVLQSMQQIVDEVISVLLPLKEKPWFLLATSETRITAPKRSELSDDDFLKWLISIGGTPPELLANPEVLKLFLPALKADLHVVENYRSNKPDHPFLSCPVTCFDGKDDIPHDLQAWKDITSGDFTIRMLDGSHFYLKESGNEKIILDYVTKHLETSEMDYL